MDFLANFASGAKLPPTSSTAVTTTVRAKQPTTTRYYRGERPSWAQSNDAETNIDSDDEYRGLKQGSQSSLIQQQQQQQQQQQTQKEEVQLKTTVINEQVVNEVQEPVRAPQPRRRAYVEAEVIQSSSITATTSIPEPPSSISVANTIISHKNDGDTADDDVSARRAKVLERLKAQKRASENSEANEQNNQSEDTFAPIGVQSDVVVRLSGSLAVNTSGSGRVISEPSVVSSGEGIGKQIVTPHERQEEKEKEEEGDGNDDDDDDDSDGEEDATLPWGYGRPLVRPIFKKKEDRITVKSAEQIEAEEAKATEELNRSNALRVEESRRLVAESVLRVDTASTAAADEDGDRKRPDDTDRPEDAEVDLDEWRLREMRRLKRDSDAAIAAAQEIADTQRRRTLDPEARAREDKDLEAQGLKVFQKVKEKRNFLQKYHHKGAFYMDEDSIKNSSTGADGVGDVRLRSIASARDSEAGFDKSALPAIMQVKNFGLKGRTKYTHLAAEDTSSRHYFDDKQKNKK
jgi:hypothetical protein